MSPSLAALAIRDVQRSATDAYHGAEAAGKYLSNVNEPERRIFVPGDPGPTVYPPQPDGPDSVIVHTRDISDALIERVRSLRGTSHITHPERFRLHATPASVGQAHSLRMATANTTAHALKGDTVRDDYANTVLSLDDYYRITERDTLTARTADGTRTSETTASIADALFDNITASADHVNALTDNTFDMLGVAGSFPRPNTNPALSQSSYTSLSTCCVE